MKAKRIGLNRAPEHAPAQLLRVSKTTLADLVWRLACSQRKVYEDRVGRNMGAGYVEQLIEVYARGLSRLPTADAAKFRSITRRALRARPRLVHLGIDKTVSIEAIDSLLDKERNKP